MLSEFKCLLVDKTLVMTIVMMMAGLLGIMLFLLGGCGLVAPAARFSGAGLLLATPLATPLAAARR
jgi:hypothetical protein